MDEINASVNTPSKDSAKTGSSRTLTAKKRIAHMFVAAMFLATGGLILETPAPVLASSDNPCSGPPGVNGTGITFDFRDACAKHDACYDAVRAKYGRKNRKNFPPFIECDNQFHANMERHCEARWKWWDPRRAGCLAMGSVYYTVVRQVTALGRS